MSVQQITNIYTALDIGSSKVSAMIAGQTGEGELIVLGTGQHASDGVGRGYVLDPGKVENSVRSAVEQAERVAGVNIDRVWAGCTSAGLSSSTMPVEVELTGERIGPDDLEYLLSHARDAITPNGRMLLHAQPALYSIDGQQGIRDPIGLHADRMGVTVHLVQADRAPVRNIDDCIRRAHLDVKSVIAAPMATGLACLTHEERELGCALVEIGAEVTNISVYVNGMLVGIDTLNWGSANITDALSSAFDIPLHQAERLKCFYGSAISSRTDHREMVPILRRGREDNENNEERIARAELISVIVRQLDRAMGDVKKSLQAMGIDGRATHPVILAGGGAELKGIADYAQGALGQTVRTGRPLAITGMPEAHSGPAFATVAGLIRFAANAPRDIRTGASGSSDQNRHSGMAIMQRLWRAMRENY